MTVDNNTRINKYLSARLGIARREADHLIREGRIHINGDTAILGAHVNDSDVITLDDAPLTVDKSAPVYLILNKPVGYVCSKRAQDSTPTIYSLLLKHLQHLKTVGRLDKNSSGLILLTNDGDFTHRMTHPSFSKRKIYNIRLDHNLEPLHQQMISEYGIQLEDGPSKLLLERLSDSSRKEWRVTMSEGRNRQIRRTFASVGYTVVRLHRTNFGPYSLGDIKRGQYEITKPMS